ncbi:unnamed protein product [Didymodactylos carnosus]|uniref:Sulfotransferase family protein n=1 Tax=Didymodactylos carnosus TaxID=1234261 RepID=A0A8S2KTA5_9BILA|nr:unnamed protein product [Didymodactylos carnosus]CAF3868917.1 unnamed protein product [Didymodactylos carnosus]
MINSADHHQKSKLRIIGAGFGRTGSKSLKIALKKLGYAKCYDMFEVLKCPEHSKFWLNAMDEGEQFDWEDLFHDYDATIEWPGFLFYQQLMVKYPDAKVILSVRDPDTWYQSIKESIYYARIVAFPARIVKRYDIFHYGWNCLNIYRLIFKLIWSKTFHNRFEDKQYTIDLFRKHNAQVQRVVPSERLLVFDVKQGWEPLCRFLDAQVPSEPFPHVNDRVQFNRRIQQENMIGWIIIFLLSSLGLLIIYRMVV